MTENLLLSYSSMNTLVSCPRKFEMYKFYQQPKRRFESIAMSAGQALHAGYQHYMIHRNPNQAMFELALNYPVEHCWDWSDDRSLEACLSTLEAMIESGCINSYDLLDIKCLDGITRPAIEVPFELVLEGVTLPDGRGISIIGYIDALVRQRFTGENHSLDIKTHRSNLFDRSPVYKFDTQQVGYGIILEHVLAHAIESFNVLYFDCYLDLLAPRVEMYEYKKTAEDIQKWMMTKIMQIKNLVTYANIGFFPRSDNGCLSYMRPCHRLDICQIEDRELLQIMILGEGEPDEPKKFEPWIRGIINIPEGVM